MKECNHGEHLSHLPGGDVRREQVLFLAAGKRLSGEVIRPRRKCGSVCLRDIDSHLSRGTKGVRETCAERWGGGNHGKKERVEKNNNAGKGERIVGGNQERPWLVFLHEGLGSVRQWRDFPSAICGETGLPGLVYDRWGYGASEACDERGNSEYLHHEAQASLPQVLDHFGIDRAIFVGHSDGGSIALIFGAAHPERTMGIITEAAHVFVEEVTLAGIVAAVSAYENTDLKARLERYHAAKTELVFRRWSETWLAPNFRGWNIEAILPLVRCPALAIQGEDDPYGTPAQVESIVSRVSGPAEGFLVPRCGHIPHHQARTETTAAMVKFIMKHS